MDTKSGVLNILSTALVAYGVANLNNDVWIALLVGLIGAGIFILKEYLKKKGIDLGNR